ncbi:phytochrome A-associated F-box protein [Lotus japonicus]|uniref:phytochrome A-associated F-box protein n=1 Tax=Lotus japonicus TaxID=34305 RepID=UPI0025864F14|nr:phytochrome A-associated F-box protein [Lotus japonicus]
MPLFSALTDDIVLNIFAKLEDDPRDWARLSCVCTRFSSLITDFCWKNKCSRSIPPDLLSATDPPLSLHKLCLCCPGLLHAGLLFDTSDFGLDRDLGPDHHHHQQQPLTLTPPPPPPPPPSQQPESSGWSLFDDLFYDTVYAASESIQPPQQSQPPQPSSEEVVRQGVVAEARETKKRKVCGARGSHLATGTWNLSREQGSKLLARQFRDDCLYVCDWPGCVHSEEKRKYMLFRGVFKNFKRTRVWRTINDGNRRKLDLPCAFCACKHTWDLHSAFCLRRGFGFHDDGEPVVRAFVCDNGHVSGAWTDVPMYA